MCWYEFDLDFGSGVGSGLGSGLVRTLNTYSRGVRGRGYIWKVLFQTR